MARLIARGRARVARDIYARLGGASPLLANTAAQARALEAALGEQYRCFIAMRYWHPTSEEAARAVAEWAPDEIICLPLYPQFSTTTTASSLAAWRRAARRYGLDRPSRTICCYPVAEGFVAALAALIRPALDRLAGPARPPRLLLTAHGLPKRIVAAGDPYPGQVELTARAVVAALARPALGDSALGDSALARPALDWRVCYQSRVGPLEWIGPATDSEIRRAGAEGIPLVVAPISFVSEHSETLVELDLDYRRVAETAGVPAYCRVATVGIEPRFIAALAALVRDGGTRAAVCAAGDPRCAFAGAGV